MAGKRLSVGLFLDDKQFQSGLKRATSSMKKFGKSMAQTGKTLTTSLTLPVLAFGAASVKAFDDQIKAETKLRTALGQDEKAFARLKKQAQELQKLTLFGDEATIEAAAFLAQLGLNENAISKLLPLIQDFATAQNMQLGDAAKLVAKSVGSSTNALSRYGITIEGTVGETERLDSAVNALTTAFGGTASAIAQQGLGPFQQLKNELGDVSEEFGKLVLENIEPLKKALSGLAESLRGLSSEQKETIVKVAGLIAVVGPLLLIVGQFITVLGAAGTALRGFNLIMASNPFILIATAIAGVIAAVIYFAKSSSDKAVRVRNVFKKMANGVVEALNLMIKGLNFFRSEQNKIEPLEPLKLEKPLQNVGDAAKEAADAMEQLNQISKKFKPPTGAKSEKKKKDGKKEKSIDELMAEADSAMATMQLNFESWQTEVVGNTTLFEVIADGFREGMTLSDMFKNKAIQNFLAIKVSQEDLANTTQNAFGAMADSQDQSLGEMASGAANAARDAIKIEISKGVAGFMSQVLAGVPFPLNVALAAAAGSIVGSLFAKIVPPFAEGGLVTGATLGIVGEGRGTSMVNPEVIAPLDKLQGMLNQGGATEVFGRISGSDILLSSDRAKGNRKRTRGY